MIYVIVQVMQTYYRYEPRTIIPATYLQKRYSAKGGAKAFQQ